MTAECMSDVESDTDGLFHRTLTWRTAEVDELIKKCDSKRHQRIRYGNPSSRQPSGKVNEIVIRKE